MLLPQETFRADCVSWNGYKPCDIQKADNRPDCFGCSQYESAPIVLDIDSRPLDMKVLKEAESIGIVEMGGLGSILRTTAVTRAIREVNQGVSISWFTHERGTDLLRYVPSVTAIDAGSIDEGERRRLVRGLDALVNFESSSSAKDIVTHAKVVGGFALNAQGKFFGVSPYAEYFQRLQIDDDFRQRNTLTIQQILLRSIGLEEHQPQYEVSLSELNYHRAEQVLQRAFGNQRPNELIGLNIGTSESGRARRWPVSYHASLAQLLTERYPDKGIVVLSGPEDKEVREQFVAKIGRTQANITTLPGALDVGDFIGVVSRLSLLVTSNTFALHAARSQETRVITFENPLPPQEMELGAEDIWLGPKLACGPCYNRCNQPIFAQCMRVISVDEVAEQVTRSLLSKAA